MTPPLNTPMFDARGTITIQWKNWFLGEASETDGSALFGDPRPTHLSQLDNDRLFIDLATESPTPTQVSHLDNDAGYLDAIAAGVLIAAALASIVDLDISGVYKITGVQVVGPQQPDPGTSASSPGGSTSNTTRTAGTTYTAANEQQMLNELKTAVGNANFTISSLQAQVNNLITDRDNLRAVLQAHGLMA